MLLATKTAIVYGASGAIGSAVARAYAREGADVHLAGRTTATLERVAQSIRHDGGGAHVAQVDVLDRTAVARHADAVAARGGIDICFNATSHASRAASAERVRDSRRWAWSTGGYRCRSRRSVTGLSGAADGVRGDRRRQDRRHDGGTICQPPDPR
ncbi:MAG TPA: SDR family NAD(P)-dependent oxidoreductase [Streptosporangiaceae bacterium]|nr:SDR family NAD(P)-dependent oxidoreductase [Streptosporangiaceae bacterium]